jgi:hypothetical protein
MEERCGVAFAYFYSKASMSLLEGGRRHELEEQQEAQRKKVSSNAS